MTNAIGGDQRHRPPARRQREQPRRREHNRPSLRTTTFVRPRQCGVVEAAFDAVGRQTDERVIATTPHLAGGPGRSHRSRRQRLQHTVDREQPYPLRSEDVDTSATCVTRREPSPLRTMCTTRSMAADNCSRTASSGSATSLISTMVSSRRSASAGEFGMARRQRAFVPGVHRLHHVERLAAPHLADDDAIGSHAQRVADQRPDGDRTEPVGIRRARLEAHDVVPGQAQLGRVFNRDHPLASRECSRGERVEQRGLACTGAAAHEDVAASPDRPFEQLGHARRAQLVQTRSPARRIGGW